METVDPHRAGLDLVRDTVRLRHVAGPDARRQAVNRVVGGGDINDTTARLAGVEGVAMETFQSGQGRVQIDGQEWAAELEDGGALIAGTRVVVVDVGGSRLTVRAR